MKYYKTNSCIVSISVIDLMGNLNTAVFTDFQLIRSWINLFGPPGKDGRFIMGRCLYCRLQFLDYVINTFLSLVYIGRCQCLFFTFGHCFVCPSSSRLHLVFFLLCIFVINIILAWLSFMCMFCRSLFVLFSFFFWPMWFLFFVDLRIRMTHSNSSFIDIYKLFSHI